MLACLQACLCRGLSNLSEAVLEIRLHAALPADRQALAGLPPPGAAQARLRGGKHRQNEAR
ncbi:hypothetical protein APV28_1919 [Comamonas testosteroni]|nr:hypothetical protein APV28_1919 [Comamonas testosteroni]